jgi:hypothetical protein
MGIIGSPVPFMTRMAEVDIDTVQVLKLDRKNRHQIAKTIREFRTELTTGSGGKKGSQSQKRFAFNLIKSLA